jgi:hypothetical protein
MLSDNLLSDNIMLSDNIVLSDNMLSYFFFLKTWNTFKNALQYVHIFS